MKSLVGTSRPCSWTSPITPTISVQVLPLSLRDGLRHDSDLSAFGAIAAVEIASTEQGNAEDLQIAGADDVELCDGLSSVVALLALDVELIVEGGRFVERKIAGGGDGGDSGKGLHFFQERGEEGESFFVAGVAGEIEAELNGEDVVGAEAGVDVLKINQAAHGETGADEEEEGNGDLRDDEGAAKFAADSA